MRNRILELPAFAVAGFSVAGGGENIPTAWRQLAARRADWPSLEQFAVGHPSLEAGLRFLAGVRLPPGCDLPPGMELEQVPAGLYYRYHHSGDRRQLSSVMGRAFSELVPAAGRQCAYPLLFAAEHAGDASDPTQYYVSCDVYIHLD